MRTTQVLAVATVVSITNDQTLQFVTGLLDGLVHYNHFDKIKPCLTDVEVIQKELEEALELFKKKDPDDVAKAIAIVGKILKQVDTDLTDCVGI